MAQTFGGFGQKSRPSGRRSILMINKLMLSGRFVILIGLRPAGSKLQRVVSVNVVFQKTPSY